MKLKHGLAGLFVAALLLIALTSAIAWQAPKVHADLMQQLANSGLVREQQQEFHGGWLTARSSGRIVFDNSLCQACEALAYTGKLYQGLGALLAGNLALIRLDYAITLPLSDWHPGLPPLSLQAQQAFSGLKAQLSLPASTHQGTIFDQTFDLQQQGIRGTIQHDRLKLLTPGLRVDRINTPWLSLDQLAIEARVNQELEIHAQAQRLTTAAWGAERPKLHWQQVRRGEVLDLKTRLNTASSQLSGQAAGPPSQAGVQVKNLHLAASLGLLRGLPPLLDESTSTTARMFGLISLYSLYGAAFFSAQPFIHIDVDSLPTPAGPAEINLQLAVVNGVRRAPMHPQEWRRALRGHVEVQASRTQLQSWWQTWASGIHLATGLPRDYRELIAAGWVYPQADGRDRLAFELQPPYGARPWTSAPERQAAARL